MIVAITLSLALAAQDVSASSGSPAPIAEDLECATMFSVAMGLAGNDPNAVRGTLPGLMFYLGKLKAHDPAADWPARIESQVAELGVEGVMAKADRCAEELSASGALIPQIGQGVMRAANAPKASSPN